MRSASSRSGGEYRVDVTTGPGEYTIWAETGMNSERESPVRERFERTLSLAECDDVGLDLRTWEPVVLPVRVLDHELGRDAACRATLLLRRNSLR